MSYEQRDNSGSLFKNDRKERDSQPDYTGSCMVDGVDYYINGWLKEGNGKKFFSFSFKRKEPKQDDSAKVERFSREVERNFGPPDDDIPF